LLNILLGKHFFVFIFVRLLVFVFLTCK
jgi:hypothetical protein